MNVKKLAELAELVGGDLSGGGDRLVKGVAPLDQANSDELAFLANPRYARHMAETKAAAVIVSADYDGPTNVPLIRCKEPYYAFRQAMVAIYGFPASPFIGLHRRSYIDQRATIGKDVAIGPFAVACEGAVIGDRTVLYPGAFVGRNVRIGADCVLHPNVTVYDDCVIGDRVRIHANTVIGEDGFGYATYKGAHHKIPQAGWVEIGNDVEIGACCTIDRATIGTTKIGDGSKFSNLIAIGHGTRVGKHNLLVAQTGLAGSVNAGDYCVFAGQAGVVGHITIGDRVRVGAQAGVVNDIEPDGEVLGSPAIPLTQAKRAMVAQTQLPALREEVRKLRRELDQLKKRLDQIGPSDD